MIQKFIAIGIFLIFSVIAFAQTLTSTIPADHSIELITTILSIGTVVGPIFFGYILWKMNQIFVSKEVFLQYKESIERELKETQEQLKQISVNTSELLKRTAQVRKI